MSLADPRYDTTPILNDAVRHWIVENEDVDENEFLLQHRELYGVSASWIAQQLIGRRKAKRKLPVYYSNEHIVYPPSIHIEQSSSQRTAEFKAEVVRTILPDPAIKIADLTLGLGMDAYSLSKICSKLYATEPLNPLLFLTQHNHQWLGADNIEYSNKDSVEYLMRTLESFDLIFIDPSRRKEGLKTFRFTDALPAIPEMLPLCFSRAPNVLVKGAPFLDIKFALGELHRVISVWVVAVENECKEILFHLIDRPESIAMVHAVHLTKSSREHFSFSYAEEAAIAIDYSPPGQYIYEPNVSFVKAGMFKLLTRKFPISKLHPNTHLYTADQKVMDFPGRIFQFKASLNKQFDSPVNIVLRNYPLSPENVLKKYKLKEGGSDYLLGFTATDKPHLWICERLK